MSTGHAQDANVDPAEIAKFEELASRWWDRDSEFKPLHDINPLRANYIDEHSPVAGKTLVDVGCGSDFTVVVSSIESGFHKILGSYFAP